MRALVTGASGFVGRHLIRHLAANGDEVAGLAISAASEPAGVATEAVDIRDGAAVAAAVRRHQPDAIYHLAGFASVRDSWSNRRAALEINVLGALSVLEAARELSPKPRVLLVGSRDEYGPAADAEAGIDETEPLAPVSPYGVSKAAAELLGRQYAASDAVPVLLVRAFNHTGPGQPPEYVVPEWAKAVAEIERGAREPVLEVGDLDVERDLSDVRDIVALYRLLVEKGRSGEAYNACSGVARPLGDVVAILARLARVPFTVRPRPGGGRPGEARVIRGRREKALREVGWEPRIPLEETLRATLEHWRAVLAAEAG